MTKLLPRGEGASRCDILRFSLVKRLVRPCLSDPVPRAKGVSRALSNIRVTRVPLPGWGGCGNVRAMKFKSYKNWATVLCAAAVFSFITLRDAQAGRTSDLAILPPPPISGTTGGTAGENILPPPPIDDNLGGETLNGDFSGVLVVD